MSTLTVTELADIRDTTGASDPVVFSDAKIQAQFDLATADAPETALILPYTYVYILRRLWGHQRLRQDRTTTHGDRQTRSQIKDASKELLDYWEGVAGIGDGKGGRLGTLTVGMLNLDIDDVCDEDEA